MEALFANMTLILAVIGILAFCVSVITQVIKNVGFLSKIPTDALVLVLSIGITVAAFVAYMQYIHMTILWYMILAAIMAGFMWRLFPCSDGRKLRNCGNERPRLMWIS